MRRHASGDAVKVERVSVTPAAITTWEGIKRHAPDLVISVGTAGGVKSLGAVKRHVYLTQAPVKYFDRLIDFRAPGDDFQVTNYKAYGIGSYPVLPCPNMVKGLFYLFNSLRALELQLDVGTVGTSSSFSLPEGLIKDQFVDNGTMLKDMEAATVAGFIFGLIHALTAFRGSGDAIGTIPGVKRRL